MAYYLSKYKGIYRLRTEYDQETNDFYRDKNGSLIDTEVYIDCRRGRIYHYGGSTLIAYVEPCDDSYRTGEYRDVYCGSLMTRTENHKEYINKECTIEKPIKKVEILKTYGTAFSSIIKKHKDKIENGSIITTDIGGCFKFNAKHIDIFTKEMKAYTNGSKTSPFSTKNLPKAKYNIPEKDLERMKVVTKPLVDDNKIYLITKAYKDFAIDNGLDLKSLSKEHLLKPKELYHKLGYFDELIEYIKNIPLDD